MDVGCPGTQGLELLIPNPGSKNIPKTCPTCNPATSPALPKASGLTQPGEKGARGLYATAPKGPDLRHPTQVRENSPQAPYLLR